MIWNKLANIWRGITVPLKSRLELIGDLNEKILHEEGLSKETKESLDRGIEDAKAGRIQPAPKSIYEK